MPSIVIAAHNEENVIARSLDALLAQQSADPIEIIVSANGCTDRTADIARRPGVVVVDRPEPGKAAALNAGDRAATGFPRIYLDADIVVPPGGLAAVVARFAESPHALALVPRRRLDTVGRTWPVRAYFSIQEGLPVFASGLFGRGMIALTAEGRARFDTFPDLIADDLFLDAQFSNAEKVELSGIEVVVAAPFTTRDLVRRLVRVRRGNAQMRSAAAAGRVAVRVRSVNRWSWLRDVVLPHPRLLAAAVPYVLITLAASLLARRAVNPGEGWGQDESTRRNQPAATDGASA
jgi:glycosyltransferase involved in cell wall biosynthesis